MKLLGTASSLAAFRWDLLYLCSQLTADDRPGVVALAPAVETAMNDLETRQFAYEQARAATIKATALVAKRDKNRDRLILELGGVARATGRDTYSQLFPKHSPSVTAKLGMDAESEEVERIVGELGALESTHPLRKQYETTLSAAQTAFLAAKSALNAAEMTLKLERSHVQRCKADLDKLRLETHGKLLVLLTDKSDADSFYRPTSVPTDEAQVN